MQRRDTPHLENMIVSSVHRGNGTEKDPHRSVIQIHTPDGDLVAEKDPECPRYHNGVWLLKAQCEIARDIDKGND